MLTQYKKCLYRSHFDLTLVLLGPGDGNMKSINRDDITKKCKTMSVSELATYYNRSEDNIKKYLAKFDLLDTCYRRDPNNLNAEDISKIKRLSTSLSIKNIAHILGIDNFAVSRALKA